MPKEVIVLGLEGSALRGLKLSENGKASVVAASEAWDLSVSSPADETSEAPAAETAEGEAAVEDTTAADLLAGAFSAAVKTFGTHEFVLALPLSKMLVETVRVPVEERDELQEKVEDAIKAISPFPDEQFRVSPEIIAETDREVIALAAALPESVSEEIGAALEAAKARVVRTDATALGRLRSLWPRIVSKGAAARRLVLMDLDDGWDFVVLDDDAPVEMRGLGSLSAAELAREVTLGLIRCEGAAGGRDIAEVVVLTHAAELSADIQAKLAVFGPVRVETVPEDESFAGVEGVANRCLEASAFDATPETWDTALRESRFKKKLFKGLLAAGSVWLLAMFVLFGVPLYFNWRTSREKTASKAHAKSYQSVKDMRDRVKLVQRYSDHARGVLEMLKIFADNLPEGVTLTQFQYKRGESVRVSAEADQTTTAYAFKDKLVGVVNDDGERLFAEVVLSEVKQSRGGLNRFDVEAKFRPEDDDAPAASAGKAKGGR